MKDITKLMPVEFEKIEDDLELPEGDFTAKVQPNYAITSNLCGYTLQFSKHKNKQGKWVYPVYTVDSRKFPPLYRDGATEDPNLSSVLPEILTKLAAGPDPVVVVQRIDEVKPGKQKEKEK